MRLILTLCMFASIGAFAQNVDYDKIILPESSGAGIEFREKLVQLAWKNNPANRIVEQNDAIARLNEKKTKRALLDVVQLVGNANEFNINPSADVSGRADFFPRYNVGLRVSVGQLFSQGVNNQIEAYKISQTAEDINLQKLKIREEVLSTYNTMKMHEEIFRIDEAALNDAELSHNLIEDKFKIGEESYERYITSLSNLNRSKVSKLRSETDYNNTKLRLEAIIGVRLEDVY